ncbi:MAG: FtsQ-type POTRA domain-containing protein [Leptospiraceae bacterium]|nr:FtsQ-type POTRA domain-containing protein [Leptospiraceae bacterium]
MYALEWIKQNGWKIGSSFVVFSLTFLLYEFSKNSSEVSGGKIVLNGHRLISKQEIFFALGVNENSKIQDLKPEEMEKKLLKIPRIREVRVSLRAKNQLLISITEGRAVYLVRMNDSIYEIDKDDRVLSIDDVREENLITITGEFTLKEGKLEGSKFKDLKKSIDLTFQMYPEFKPRISEFKIMNEGTILIYLHNPRVKVILGNSFDKLQIRKLYSAIAYLENETVSLSILDLRGEDAVFQ